MPGRHRARSGNSASRWLPVAYYGAAVLAVIFLLPTILRPPSQRPPQTAELSPDAPPNADQSIVATFNRGQSATAGQGTGQGAAAEPGAVPGEGPGPAV